MCKYKFKNSISTILLLAFLLAHSAISARTISVPATEDNSEQSAGFSFTANEAEDKTNNNSLIEPVIFYEQNIYMLSDVDDRPSLQIFGTGRVLVHLPVYMKNSGDYEMQLDEAELINLIRSMSNNGLMDFDAKKIKEKIITDKKASKARGQFYAISDTVETTVEIRLDTWQKNKASGKTENFYKKFNWKNIKHDATRYSRHSEITRANNSVNQLKMLMKDARLAKKGTP